jgi:hypothetical protein
VEYLDFGGEFGKRWWKVITSGVMLSKDKMLEGNRKSGLHDIGGKYVEGGWVALFHNIIE